MQLDISVRVNSRRMHGLRHVHVNLRHMHVLRHVTWACYVMSLAWASKNGGKLSIL